MPCYSPLKAFRSKFVNLSGKRSLVFNERDALQPDDPLMIPCGQCIGCRLKYSAQWAARCFHESQLYEDNCFLTLTFSPEFLPADGNISVRDCQLFIKRLRKKFSSVRIRFAYCGEYGELSQRPHYHLLVFGFDFPDKTLWSEKDGMKLWRSEILEQLWPFGNSLIGSLSFDSAAYVARYMCKKLKGKGALGYTTFDPLTGEILHERTPEFFHMSRRPGIGRGWFEKFFSDCYPSDFFVVDGRKFMPPKYYDSQFEIVNPYVMDDVKEKRLVASRSRVALAESTPERLTVREKVKAAEINQLKRSYESDT